MKPENCTMTRPVLLITSVILLIHILSNGNQVLMATDNLALEIIPKPVKAKVLDGYFEITKGTMIVVKDGSYEMATLGNYLAEILGNSIGRNPIMKINPSSKVPEGSIVLNIKNSPKSLGAEGYILSVTRNSVSLSALKPAGIFYGVQTIRQIMLGRKEETIKIPCSYIEDKPRYEWRGMLLDCCRHFMTADFIKRYIDLLAYHKMNVFHWHLTEDQGWRLEIKKYPLLTEIGAWREENGHRYGGFYTQEEVKDIVAYAKSRYVRIVPEIEMPGHSTAALAAYPEFSCTGRPLNVETNWGVFKDVYCPGKEETFEFLQNILKEVCDLFPSPYIHIGGDEVPKDNWKKCPDCQKRIKDEGLKDEHELQGYLTKRIDAYMQTLGRNIIGWDEILEGGVSKTAVVQSWRGLQGAITAAGQGNYVISSPWEPVYFYCPQIKEEVKEGSQTINTLEKVYAFEPVPPELTPEQAKYILGGECCMWNEYTYQFEVDPQIFPRLCALCEVLWSPAESRDYSDFARRLDLHYNRLDELGVDYYRAEVLVGKWQAEQIGKSFSQLCWDVTDHVTKNGIYRVNLVLDKGEDDLYFQWAALFQDNKQVARYTHYSRSQRNFYLKYPLRLENYNPDATYTLRISIGGNKDNETSGLIYLRHFKDNGIDIP